MSVTKEESIPHQYLLYDFSYEGQRHKGRIRLSEDTPNLELLYDDHNVEITWLKHIRHGGKEMELTIVINDDAYDSDEGKVVASAWVSVYQRLDRCHHKPIDQFEPDYWAYIDECDERNSMSKETFYNH